MTKYIPLVILSGLLAACGSDPAPAPAPVSRPTPAAAPSAPAAPRMVVSAAAHNVERSLERRLQLAADQLEDQRQTGASASTVDPTSKDLAQALSVSPGSIVKVRELTLNQVISNKLASPDAQTIEVDTAFVLTVDGKSSNQRVRLTMTQANEPQILRAERLLSFRAPLIDPSKAKP